MTVPAIVLTVSAFAMTVHTPPYSSDIRHDSSPDCPSQFLIRRQKEPFYYERLPSNRHGRNILSAEI